MSASDRTTGAEAEVLGPDAPDPDAVDITPGWIARNRATIETGRSLVLTAMTVAPPPARLALAAVSVAAQGVLLADDLRRRRKERGDGVLEGAALVLEGAALAAMSRHAPARLARNIAGIEGARRMVGRLRVNRSPG